jgi:S-layer homology domain
MLLARVKESTMNALRMSIPLVIATCIVVAGCGSGSSSGASAAASPAATDAAGAAAAATATPVSIAVQHVAFTDIGDAYARQAITDLATLGVIEPATGAFRSNDPITRAEFVGWLVKANNIYYMDTPAQQIRLAEDGQATFVDLSATNPDFKYIQGMANAGYVIGVDKTHFRPDDLLTREQMVGIKASRDLGGASSNVTLDGLQTRVDMTDVAQVNKAYWGPLYDDFSTGTSNNVARVYGSLKTFDPRKPVTRGEAALVLSVFGGEIPARSAAALLRPSS